tara:strand:- start:214 stop:327 length:114 start_codon:yes stop_codon:yes gene_type:complete
MVEAHLEHLQIIQDQAVEELVQLAETLPQEVEMVEQE